jgi:hypothetical protein
MTKRVVGKNLAVNASQCSIKRIVWICVNCRFLAYKQF